MERLSKYLAQAGVASRREADRLIEQGIIRVNNKIITELGTKIEPGKDKVFVNNKEIQTEENVYYLLNKPKGYTTTVKDPFARKTVLDLLPKGERIFPVGRLDRETEGLLILTNDGELTYKLTHPKFEKEKEYEVEVRGELSTEQKIKLENGINIEGRKTAPAKVKFVRNHKDKYTYSITINEGRKRQIRIMFDSVGHPVLELKRIRFDFLTLDKLKKGEYRKLTKEEVRKLNAGHGA